MGGQGVGEGAVIGLFPGLEAQVLQHGDPARGQTGHGAGGGGAGAVGGEGYRLFQAPGQRQRHRRQRHALHGPPAGAAEMGEHDRARAGRRQLPQRRQGPFQARGVGHPAVGQGQVEIEAQQHPSAGGAKVVQGAEAGHAP